MEDLGYAIWKHLNLGLIDLPPSEQGRRLRVMTGSYGESAENEVLEAIVAAQERMRSLIEGAPPGVGRDQALSQNKHERDWLTANRQLLLA